MKWKSIEFGKHKFSIIPQFGWDDASIWFVWLGLFIIAQR